MKREIGKPKIFGPLIVLVISVIESYCYLQSIFIKIILGSCRRVIHMAAQYCMRRATDLLPRVSVIELHTHRVILTYYYS
jgi:hypothetical protein